MKLIKVRVQNYRSVEDSEEFNIGELTCLVGKNEAGKTALLSAMRGLAPSQPFEFDEVIDYPRRFATRFDDRHPDGAAEVVRTWWCLDDDDDEAAVESRFGTGVLKDDIFQSHFGFRYAGGALGEIEECRTSEFGLAVVDVLSARQPKFFFTSHFERMSGMVSIEKLQQDKQNNTVSVGDKIFLDFLEYAGTSLEELNRVDRREELKAKCESASNEITEEIFQFWSQNNALEVVIEIDNAKPKDPAPYNTGMVADIRIKNTNHRATLPLSERSAGFVWFFSFLAQFKQLKKTPGNGNAIILLDEPGLTLHGKAQGDLLRYIVERLLLSDMANGDVTVDKLIAANPTPRIVKKAEALFRLMPASVATFNHFATSSWLLENLSLLDLDTPAVSVTLDRFETLFRAFNGLLGQS